MLRATWISVVDGWAVGGCRNRGAPTRYRERRHLTEPVDEIVRERRRHSVDHTQSLAVVDMIVRMPVYLYN